LSQFISIVTFPGIILHEFSHEFFCRLLGVKVKKVCYFRLGNPAGYVIHEQSRHFYQAFFIAAGPFILGTLLGALSFWVASQEEIFVRKIIWNWFGIAIAANCLPSKGDSKNLWIENWSHMKSNILAVIGLPFTLLVWLMSLLHSRLFSMAYAAVLFYAARITK
jgi:hypothetical protein